MRFKGVAFLFAAVYAWGAPFMEGMRPPMLAPGLTSFHADVNGLARGDFDFKNMVSLSALRGSSPTTSFPIYDDAARNIGKR